MAMAAWGAAVQWGPGEPPWGWHMWWGAWGIGMLVFMILFWARPPGRRGSERGELA